MKRSLKTKVRALGILQITLIAAIMMLLGVLFFNKMLSDEDRFKEGTHEVMLREAESLAKLLALELGRLDALRYARPGASGPPGEADRAMKKIRAVLWEKITFISSLDELDLIARGANGQTYACLRPEGLNNNCDGVHDIEKIKSIFSDVGRLQQLRKGVYVMPLYVAGSYWGVVRLGIPNTVVQETLQQMALKNQQDKMAFIILFIACITAAAIFLAWVLAAFFRRIHQPLIALTHNAVAFGERPETELIPVDADPEDEVGVLVRRFEEMQSRLAETIASLTQAVSQKDRAMQEMEAKDQMLRRSERMASMGVLAAGVAHEIGNKLNPMGFVVHNLKKRIEKGKPLDSGQLEVLTRSVESCSEIIDKLRSLAREDEATGVALNLNLVVDDVAMLLISQTKSRGVNIVTELSDTLPMIVGVHGDLVQVLINLVVNARQAVIDAERPDGAVTIRTSVDDQNHVVLEVGDNGTGMSDDVRDRIFEPFFTTKGLATGGGVGGTGLGLYICYGILSRHGVEPEVHTEQGQGTRFVMRFNPAETT